MRRYYSIILIFSFILLVNGIQAESNNISIVSDFKQSIATTDDLFAPIINPAAIGFGNCKGLGWIQSMKEYDFNDNYWFIANLEGLSYIYNKTDKRTNIHTISSGSELTGPYLIPNLYAGSSFSWVNNKIKDGNIHSGLMYRPLKSTSLGFTWTNNYQEAPSYKFGLGVRPFSYLSLIKEHRLELSADIDYSKNEEREYTVFKPTIGVGTEIFDGVKLKVNHDLEKEQTMLSFSLSRRKTQIGQVVNTESKSGLGYVFLSDKSFYPVLGINRPNWYSLPINKEIVTYKAPQYSFGPIKIFDNKQTDVESIINNIRKAKEDPAISGLLLVNNNFTASMALRQELITELAQFKTSDKKIVFYYDNMSNGDYVFASSVADKIYLNPQGSIDLKGIAINSPYFKDTLGKLGIEVMNFRSHAYKSAGNMLSESEMTTEERAEYELILSSIYNQMCELIQSGREDKLKKSVTETIDEGPYYDAQDALDAGLIDGLVYQSKLTETLKKEFKITKTKKSLDDYQKYTWIHPKKTKIAIIYAQGNIVMGKGQAGKKITHATTVDMIKKASKDKEIKGIILRIDSGGGSAQASDIIYNEIENVKKERKIPIITSMSGVAGSGGYYIACNSDYIIANPSTITGSIGVIGLTLNAEELFDKLYINWSTVKKGKHSDFGNMTRKWTEDEKNIMHKLIASSYSDFVSKVAKGRGKEFDEIDKIAQGRIWTGVQAKQNGLIDDVGGLEKAKEKMKSLAKIKGDIEVVNMIKSDKTIEFAMSIGSILNGSQSNIVLAFYDRYVKLYEKWLTYENERIFFLSEYDLEAISKN